MSEAVEEHPANCPDGHPLVGGGMLVGWRHCSCAPNGGHRTIECRHPVGDPPEECGAVWERPPCTGPVLPGR